MKNEIINVENMIYEINGVEVMLDSDLADLYQVETKRINEAVKNNPEKFPKRYSFVLTDKDKENLWSKFSTANISNKSRVNPRVFTEQGIYMLGTILRSKVATEVSIRIMDTFVKMRHYINYTQNILPQKYLILENKVDENTRRIDELFNKFDPQVITKDKLFFKGEWYDAYSVLMDILKKAKKEITFIDNYASKELLDMLKGIKKNITIITSNIDEVLKTKYGKQYKNVTFVKDDSFHDRFILLDNERIYHCGSSFKDLARRGFAISELKDVRLFTEVFNIKNNCKRN